MIPVSVAMMILVVVWTAIGLIVDRGPSSAAPTGSVPIVIGPGSTTPTSPTGPATTPTSTPITTPSTGFPGSTIPGGAALRDPAALSLLAAQSVFTGDWDGVPLAPGALIPPTSGWPAAVPLGTELLDNPTPQTARYLVTVDPDSSGPEAPRAVTITVELTEGLAYFVSSN